MINLTVNRGWLPFADALHRHEEFKTHGSLKGLRHNPSDRVTRLGDLERKSPNRAVDLQVAAVDFVVYSYDTPIAWHTVRRGWVVPTVTYSITTTEHQRLIKEAVDNPPGSDGYKRAVAWQDEFGPAYSPAWGVGGFGKGR